MKHELREKLTESAKSVLPLTLFVLFVNFLLVTAAGKGMPDETFLQFVIGAVFLLVGIALVELGAHMSLVPMGNGMGAFLTKSRRYPLIIICCFLIGVFVTMAEPDLAILAAQFPGVDDFKMIVIVSAGVGVLLVFGVMRVIRRVPLPVALAVFYAMVFILAFFEPGNFFSFAFDSGGVATGPIVVPFIMSIGLGLAAVRGGSRSVSEGFGMVGVCVIGPIAAMLIFGIAGRYDLAGIEGLVVHEPSGHGVLGDFLHAIPHYVWEVALALLPIIVFFLIFQFFYMHLSRHSLARIGVGLAYTYLGHMIFLTGVSVGFLPAGTYIGAALAGLPAGWNYLLIPVGMVMGSLVVMAEPVVYLLNSRVDELTVGAISKRAMTTMLSLGAAVSMGIAMLRILTGFPLWIVLLAGYSVSIILSFFVPRLFTAIAFDSGGVVSGAMAICFLLPFAKGACMELTGSVESVLTDAFGIIALISMTPVIMIQLLGLVYTVKLKKASAVDQGADDTVTIIDFGSEEAA